MNNLPRLKITAFLTLLLSAFATSTVANEVVFDQKEVDSSKFVLVASPYGDSAHQLLIVEQLDDSRPCWKERGKEPTIVQPLLVEFDFTGICARSVDSNGYSIRLSGQDLGWKYGLRVVERDGDLLLLGRSTTKRNSPELVIGHARGNTAGFAKIHLDPGWRLTRRSFEGKAVGHVYLTNDQSLAALTAPGATQAAPTATIPGAAPTSTAQSGATPAATP